MPVKNLYNKNFVNLRCVQDTISAPGWSVHVTNYCKVASPIADLGDWLKKTTCLLLFNIGSMSQVGQRPQEYIMGSKIGSSQHSMCPPRFRQRKNTQQRERTKISSQLCGHSQKIPSHPIRLDVGGSDLRTLKRKKNGTGLSSAAGQLQLMRARQPTLFSQTVRSCHVT